MTVAKAIEIIFFQRHMKLRRVCALMDGTGANQIPPFLGQGGEQLVMGQDMLHADCFFDSFKVDPWVCHTFISLLPVYQISNA